MLSFEGGFHGRSLGALSATRSKAIHKLDFPAFDWPVLPFPANVFPLEDHAAENRDLDCLGLVTLVLIAPDGLGLPDLQEEHQGGHRDDGADDVHQPGAVVVAHGELRDGEAATGHEAGGPDFHHGLASGHGPNDPEGHDQREDGQDAARGGAEQVQIQAGDAGQGDEGAAQSAVGHGSGVADEGQAGGLEGAEAQTDQHGGGNRHRGAEAGRALDEGPEAEGDQQGLDAAVARQPGDGVLHHLEVTGLDGDVVD